MGLILNGEERVLYTGRVSVADTGSMFAVVLLEDHQAALLEKQIEIDKLKAEIRRMRPGYERDSWSRSPGQGAS